MLHFSKPMVMTWVVAATAVAMATGGAALASDASPASSIHGCVNKTTGYVRVASHCSSAERALTWNRQGPTGSKGSKGSKGDTGLTGLTGNAGTAVGYTAVGAGATLSVGANTEATAAGLAAGPYVLSASLTLTTTGADTVTCSLNLNGAPVDSVTITAAGIELTPVFLAGGGTAAASASATVTCTASTITGATSDVRLTAVGVTTFV